MRVVFRSRWRPPAGVRGQSCRSVHSPAATAGPGACRTDHAPHVGWRPWPTGIASGGDRCWRSLACLSSSRSSSPFCLRRRLWLHARRFRRPLAPGPHLERWFLLRPTVRLAVRGGVLAWATPLRSGRVPLCQVLGRRLEPALRRRTRRHSRRLRRLLRVPFRAGCLMGGVRRGDGRHDRASRRGPGVRRAG